MKTITSLSELNDLAATGDLLGLVRVPIELYHAGPGISSTGLKEILKSPAHYLAYLEGQEDSAAFRLGRLVHMRILEPEVYAASVVVAPPMDGRTTAGKAAKEAFLASSAGKEVVSANEHAENEKYAKAASSNKLASKIFQGGQAELSVYWVDEETKVLCKARADYLRGEAIFDLKTTSYSAAPKEFQKTVLNLSYHVSAAFYLDGFASQLPVKHFSWVVVEKKPPNCFGFFAADQELLNAGRAEYTKALATFAECLKTQVWSGYPEQFVNLSLTGV